MVFSINNLFNNFYFSSEVVELVKPSYSIDSPGEKVLLLGNEAIARGALEAGVRMVAGYPGTPATEIVETIAKMTKHFPEIYVEWSINEKVGFETAFGGSMSGLRSAAVLKHVGLNVALDPFVTACYAGARGGFVLIEADDPNCYSSQNEQDNRNIAKHALCPIFEPSNVHEAKEMTKYAFDFSERLKTVVMLRSTTRLSHSRGDVTLGAIRFHETKGKFDHDKERWTFLPVNARIYRKIMLERFKKIEEEVNNVPFNKVQLNKNSKVGIIAPGLPFAYVIDYLKENQLENEISYLKLATSFPPPRKLIVNFIKNLDHVLVVEELEPFIEEYLHIFAKEVNPDLRIIGKELLPRNGELTPHLVEIAMNTFLNRKAPNHPAEGRNGIQSPPRPPVLCAGCPHRACFYALKGAEKKFGAKFIYSSDIGCYTLGFYPPLETIEACLCMGASIGMAHGLSKSGEESPIFAILGDSTFFHSGIPALANLVYNKSTVNVLVLDNLSTAMTGFQPHPGTGILITGEQGKRILIEDVAKGLGVKFIRVFDPYDLKSTIDVLIEAINYTDGPTLLISRQNCSILDVRVKKKKGDKIDCYMVDTTKCNNCRICTSTFGCPAFFIDEETNEISIMRDLCSGCGVCDQICPENAIQRID
ncbi:MAG: indolepyruvate ferredoxin oxidoreductase subunit alpha [Candidatus Helarchaeota archaeon]|nr:indolepyruvate ferredoxin oxidoreductase subunit alpha [Candidatus Helarchaeota archaeon]